MSAVVVGYVPSPEGRAALDTGISEARLRGARLVVVNTTRGDALVDDRYLAGDGLAALQAELDALDLETELRQPTTYDDVADDLDAIADEVGADLIVIGLRRRSPVGKLILGSAASRILLTAHHAVLAVKA
ncbi:universal stress protein [Microlunatus antarcticus]|uniref:Nucleotide-binding universal stress UspA family protein n=1 Tax=Microlunatus antarcticus TaxID=53388 RepID=A0A7W5P8K5_9ACTN|nr:nucleotide-binding universal stress UspA family protein [Microlunatus antarcticus]